MSEAEGGSAWGEESAPKKRRIPTWLWFCGGGCLVAVILGVIALGWVLSEVKTWGQAEKQLPELAKALPFDPLPADLQFALSFHLGVDGYAFHGPGGTVALFYVVPPGREAEVRDTLLNPEFSGGFFGTGGRKDVRAVTIRVQGREVGGLRFEQQAGGGGANAPAAGEAGGPGPSLALDITPEGRAGLVVVHMQQRGGAGTLSDDDVRNFLKPFHVGPER